MGNRQTGVVGKIFAVIFSIAAITYTYPRVAQLLRDGAPPVIAQTRTAGAPDITPTDMGPWPKSHFWQEHILTVADYASFVREALPEANKGNADAQFALYAAFSFCRDGFRERTPEERQLIPEAIWADMHRRCDALAPDYPDLAAEAERWLRRALDSKFPRAIAFAAIEDVERLKRGQVPRSEETKFIANVKSRLVTALRSHDPAITEGVAKHLAPLFPDEPRVAGAYWVWRLAACVQGLDCRPGVGWLREACQIRGNCVAGESGQQYIRRVAGDLPSLQVRALDIARKLSKSDFTPADFDASVESLPPAR